MKVRTWPGPVAVMLLVAGMSACTEDAADPLLGLPVESSSPQVELLQQTEPQAATATVLVVDNDSDVRHLVSSALLRQGYVVLQAEGGAEALALVAERAGSLDLLLTEVNTPTLSGLELAEALAEDHPQLEVLFLVTASEVGSVPGDVLLKEPFTGEGLLAAVRVALGHD